MRRVLLPLLLVGALSAGLLAAEYAAPADVGQPGTEQPIDVGPFRTLKVAGRVEVVLHQGTRESVEVEPTSSGRSRIRVRADKGVLTITATDSGSSWWPFGASGSRPPRLNIHFRTLDNLEASGAVRLSADRVTATDLAVRASGAVTMRIDALQADTLRFAGSGAVKTELAGQARSQDVSISGAGVYRAAQFVTDRAEVKVSGAGRVVVHATSTLDAAISGAGAIDYHGDPQVRQRISGAGRIKRASDPEPRLRGIQIASVDR